MFCFELISILSDMDCTQAIKAERISDLIPETRGRIALLALELKMADADLAVCARADAQTPDANATTDFSSDAAAGDGSSSAEVNLCMCTSIYVYIYLCVHIQMCPSIYMRRHPTPTRPPTFLPMQRRPAARLAPR